MPLLELGSLSHFSPVQEINAYLSDYLTPDVASLAQAVIAKIAKKIRDLYVIDTLQTIDRYSDTLSRGGLISTARGFGHGRFSFAAMMASTACLATSRVTL